MALSKDAVDRLAGCPPNLKVAMEVWTLTSIKGRMQTRTCATSTLLLMG